MTQSRSSARPTKNAGCWSPMDDAFAAAIVGISTRAVTGRAGSPCVRATRGSGSSTTTRVRCSRVETVEERRWWYSASRAGFWRVLAARLSPLDVSPGRWFPRAERRNHSTQRCPAATLMRDLFCCCKKCSVAKNANSADSGPIKTAPRPNSNENDVSKNVVLNCWIPCSGWAILRAVCDSTRALDPAESHSTRDPIPTPPRSSDEPAPWLSSRGCASPPPPKKLSPPEFNSLSCNPPPGVFVA